MKQRLLSCSVESELIRVAKEDLDLSLPPKLPFGLRTSMWTSHTCVSEATCLYLHVYMLCCGYRVTIFVSGFPFMIAAYIGIYDEHPRSDDSFAALVFLFFV
ncbi:hypothetical protein Plhal304r1_c071g0159611 [Plasmopara halstedii]